MKTFRIKILPSATVLTLAAILGHFLYHDPPDVLGALNSLPSQFDGEWQFPMDGAMGLLTVSVMWFSAAGVGHWILQRFGGDAVLPSFWARWVFAALIGWILISLSTFALGIAGYCNRRVLGSLMIAIAAAALRGWTLFFNPHLASETSTLERESDETEPDAAPKSKEATPMQFSVWVLVLMAALYLLAVPYALTPAVESDELRYHLAAPQAWLESGKIEYLPHQAFSNFPFLVEMLYTVAMALQGTEGAKLIHLSFLESSAILVALLTYLMIRLTFSNLNGTRAEAARSISAFAACAFAAIPCALILGCWAFNDLAVVAYFLAVFYLGTLMLVRHHFPPAWLLGMMVAGALGTKYTMSPLMVAMLALLLVLSTLKRKTSAPEGGNKFRPASFFLRISLIAVAFGSPWFIKNIFWTGNPFYPLGYGVFGGSDWSDANTRLYVAKAAEKGFRLEHLIGWLADHGIAVGLPTGHLKRAVEFLLTPITTSLASNDFERHFLGPLPLMAMALMIAGVARSWIARGSSEEMQKRESAGEESPRLRVFAFSRRKQMTSKRRSAALWLVGVILGSWIYWFLTYQSNRFLLPTFALIIAAGGWGIMVLLDEEQRFTRAGQMLAALGSSALIYTLAWTAVLIIKNIGAEEIAHPLPVALGFESREEYLKRRLGYYESARWLAPKISAESKALLIGEHRSLYFPKDILVSDWFDTPQPLLLIQATKDNNELFDRLKKEKVRYVFFNRLELSRYVDLYFKPRFTKEEFARFDALIGFENHQPDPRLELIHLDWPNKVYIYAIRSDGERPKSKGAGS